MSKDMWFAAMEQRLAELEDEGVPFDQAYERPPENEAHGIMIDRLADMADIERKRRKEEGRLMTAPKDSRRCFGRSEGAQALPVLREERNKRRHQRRR